MRAAAGIPSLVAALGGLQAWSKRAPFKLSCSEREQLQHDVRSLVVVARRELAVQPLAVRFSSHEAEMVGTMQMGRHETWTGVPKKKMYALHGTGQARHDDEPVECEEDTSARLLTTDLRFERTQLLADALAMLVLARAPSGIQARDEHRRKKRLRDDASRQMQDLLGQRAVQDLQQQSGKPWAQLLCQPCVLAGSSDMCSLINARRRYGHDRARRFSSFAAVSRGGRQSRSTMGAIRGKPGPGTRCWPPGTRRQRRQQRRAQRTTPDAPHLDLASIA